MVFTVNKLWGETTIWLGVYNAYLEKGVHKSFCPENFWTVMLIEEAPFWGSGERRMLFFKTSAPPSWVATRYFEGLTLEVKKSGSDWSCAFLLSAIGINFTAKEFSPLSLRLKKSHTVIQSMTTKVAATIPISSSVVRLFMSCPFLVSQMLFPNFHECRLLGVSPRASDQLVRIFQRGCMISIVSPRGCYFCLW